MARGPALRGAGRLASSSAQARIHTMDMLGWTWSGTAHRLGICLNIFPRRLFNFRNHHKQNEAVQVEQPIFDFESDPQLSPLRYAPASMAMVPTPPMGSKSTLPS